MRHQRSKLVRCQECRHGCHPLEEAAAPNDGLQCSVSIVNNNNVVCLLTTHRAESLRLESAYKGHLSKEVHQTTSLALKQQLLDNKIDILLNSIPLALSPHEFHHRSCPHCCHLDPTQHLGLIARCHLKSAVQTETCPQKTGSSKPLNRIFR
jgi:hypothetical protein